MSIVVFVVAENHAFTKASDAKVTKRYLSFLANIENYRSLPHDDRSCRLFALLVACFPTSLIVAQTWSVRGDERRANRNVLCEHEVFKGDVWRSGPTLGTVWRSLVKNRSMAFVRNCLIMTLNSLCDMVSIPALRPSPPSMHDVSLAKAVRPQATFALNSVRAHLVTARAQKRVHPQNTWTAKRS